MSRDAIWSMICRPITLLVDDSVVAYNECECMAHRVKICSRCSA